MRAPVPFGYCSRATGPKVCPPSCGTTVWISLLNSPFSTCRWPAFELGWTTKGGAAPIYLA